MTQNGYSQGVGRAMFVGARRQGSMSQETEQKSA